MNCLKIADFVTFAKTIDKTYNLYEYESGGLFKSECLKYLTLNIAKNGVNWCIAYTRPLSPENIKKVKEQVLQNPNIKDFTEKQ